MKYIPKDFMYYTKKMLGTKELITVKTRLKLITKLYT